MKASVSKISVVIPLYNKEAHILRTLQSILEQTLAPAEVILVDDGSTDNSVAVAIEAYGDQIKLVQQPNQGVSAARNNGIRAATEEVVAFIDADDTWDPHFIEEIDTLMIHFPEAICYATNYQLVYSAGEYTDPKVRWDNPPTEPGLLKNFFELGSKGELPFQMSSFCVRKSAFDYFGYFPEGEPMGEDQDLFIRAAITGDIVYSPRILSFYHKDAENRACIRNVPNKECPFSQRLYKWATMYEKKGQRQEAMIDFTAAHLLHLASENVNNNKLAEAETLLSDKRCKRHLKRYLWWKVRLLLKKTLSPFQQVPA